MRSDDVATEIEELHRNTALAFRKPVLPACGICYNCQESISANACYCDEFCREDHEKRQKAHHAAQRS